MVNLERALVNKLNESTHSQKSELSQFSSAELLSVGMTPNMYPYFKCFKTEGIGIAHLESISMDDCKGVMAAYLDSNLINLSDATTKLIALLTENKVVHKPRSLEL